MLFRLNSFKLLFKKNRKIDFRKKKDIKNYILLLNKLVKFYLCKN